jgi:streptogramin lyase
MHRNKTRLLHFRRGRIVRIVLTLLSIIASITLVWTALIGTHPAAHASTPSIRETPTPSAIPWGVAFDSNGNGWVAEPGCDGLNCTPQTGAIAHFDHQNFSLLQDYKEPAGYSSPLFLAVDRQGNVWFTEPVTNAIGELILNNGTPNWKQWPLPTASASPNDLAFDASGNLWFTEYNAGSIGEFVPSTQQFSETQTPTPNSNPYGIVGPEPRTGAMWFTENNSSVSRIASFVPPKSGSLDQSNINEYLTRNTRNSTPHLLAFDKKGNIWWTEGFDGYIGSLAISQASPGTSNGVTEYAVPPAQGCQNCTHISGIGVDSTGTIWFDDSLSSRIGSYIPGSGTFSMITVGGGTNSDSHPHDGLAVDSNDNIWFTEEFASKLGEAIQGSAVPVSKTWYFGEGRVGNGVNEFLTLDNPDLTHNCSVSINYLYTVDGSAPTSKTLSVFIPPSTRMSQSVNTDLSIQPGQVPAASVSAILTVNTKSTPNCIGIVAERPMYFSNQIKGGSDVLGATQTGQTFYFADVPTGNGFSSYLTILNPGANTATVKASYYASGQKVTSQSVPVAGGTRGTIFPGDARLPPHVGAIVTSDQPIVVERPDYFSNVNAGSAGFVSGATCIVGVPALSNDWLFAEGYTGSGFQENLVITNEDTTANVPARVTIKLEYQDGMTQSFSNLTVNPASQLTWNVNQNARPGGLAAEVASTGAKIIVEREMFFQDHLHSSSAIAIGGTDIIGQPGPAAAASYSFSEGYIGSGFDEWLTLQNPTTNTEMLSITLVNGYSRSFSEPVQVPANTRVTVNVTSLALQNVVHTGDSKKGYEISMSVRSLTGAPFVAERPMYWNLMSSSLPTQGGSDIIGYMGF